MPTFAVIYLLMFADLHTAALTALSSAVSWCVCSKEALVVPFLATSCIPPIAQRKTPHPQTHDQFHQEVVSKLWICTKPWRECTSPGFLPLSASSPGTLTRSFPLPSKPTPTLLSQDPAQGCRVCLPAEGTPEGPKPRVS